MEIPGLDKELIKRMRTMCTAGESVASIVRTMQDALGNDRTNMFTIVVYFKSAFQLPIADIVKMGAFELMGSSGFSADEIERSLLPQMRSFVAGHISSLISNSRTPCPYSVENVI